MVFFIHPFLPVSVLVVLAGTLHDEWSLTAESRNPDRHDMAIFQHQTWALPSGKLT